MLIQTYQKMVSFLLLLSRKFKNINTKTAYCFGINDSIQNVLMPFEYYISFICTNKLIITEILNKTLYLCTYVYVYVKRIITFSKNQ